MTAFRSKLTAARLAAAAAFLLVLALAGTAGASAVLPSAVFDPPSTGWVSLRDLTGAQFAQRFDELKSKGMMVVDLEVDVIGGQYRVGAVFRSNPDGRGWYSHRDLTDGQFHARWAELKGNGFRLVDQETYVAGGTRYYAGVWVENRENLAWASYRDVTSAEFSQRFDQYRDAGYLPIDVEVYPMGSGLRYGAVWVKNTEGLSFKLRRGLTSAEYGAAFDTYKAQGLRRVRPDLAGSALRRHLDPERRRPRLVRTPRPDRDAVPQLLESLHGHGLPARRLREVRDVRRRSLRRHLPADVEAARMEPPGNGGRLRAEGARRF